MVNPILIGCWWDLGGGSFQKALCNPIRNFYCLSRMVLIFELNHWKNLAWIFSPISVFIFLTFLLVCIPNLDTDYTLVTSSHKRKSIFISPWECFMQDMRLLNHGNESIQFFTAHSVRAQALYSDLLLQTFPLAEWLHFLCLISCL